MSTPIVPGRPLSARQLNRALEEIHRQADVTAAPPLEVLRLPTGVHIRFAADQLPFLAKIGSGANPYAWTEQLLTDLGTFADHPAGRSGTTTINPAYESSANASVPAGAVVWLWPGFQSATDGQEFLFSYQQNPVSPSSSPITVSADQTPLTIPTGVAVVPVSPTGSGFTIFTVSDGLVPADRAGRRVTLFVTPGTSPITLSATTSTGTAADRIINPTGLDLVVQPGQSIPLRYDGATSRWVVESSSPLWTGTPLAGRVPYNNPSGPEGLLNSPIIVGTANNIGINVTPNSLYALYAGGDIATTTGSVWLGAYGVITTPSNEIRLKVTTGNHLTLSLPDIDKYALLTNDTNDAVYAVTRPGGIKTGVDQTVAGLDFFGGLMAGGTLSVPTSALSGALPAANFPALTGDVTTVAGALATTIVAAAVTYAKLQNVSATARVLGRKTAGAGSVEECTLSNVLDFVGSAAQGDVLYRGATTWTRLGAGTSGLFLQTQGAGANPQWATPATGSGTVTSVGASGPAGILTWSSAVTTSGTLTATLVSQTASTFLAGPVSGGAAAPTFRTIAALDLPIMGAAGAAHAAGAVPDPGATAHTNIPYVLGDAGAFIKPLGRLLGSSYVSTDQTTTSTSYVDLATADSVTFTLDVTSDVLVLFLCETYSTVANDTTNSIVTLDGTDQTGTGTQTTIPTASGPQPGYATAKLTGLSAASHTVKIRHRLQAGGTGTAHFLCRSLSVFLAG